MKKIIIYTFNIILFLFILSCNDTKKHENNIKNEINDTINKSLTNILIKDVEFIPFKSQGIFLAGEVRIFDISFKGIKKININEITPVEIIEKSKKMYFLNTDSNYCLKANFVKVKYNNTELIVSGLDIYELNKKQKYPFQIGINNKYVLYVVSNFKMGVTDEDGVTECDENKILVLNRLKDNYFSLIENTYNENVHKDKSSKYFVLNNDEICGEEVYKVSVQNDIIIIGIKAICQEGGFAFNLKVTYDEKLSKANISDYKYYKENEIKNLENLK